MLYLIDTADLDAIKKCSEFFPVSGVTTNPTIISREKTDFRTLLYSIREIIGAGSWAGIELTALKPYAVSIVTAAPGGFLVFGCLIALVNKLFAGKNAKKEFSCEGCPNAALCNKENCETEAKEENK